MRQIIERLDAQKPRVMSITPNWRTMLDIPSSQVLGYWREK